MEPQKIPIEILLTPDELVLLDRARVISTPPTTRAEFVILTLRYAWLALDEACEIDIEVDGRIPPYALHYWEVMRRMADEGRAKEHAAS